MTISISISLRRRNVSLICSCLFRILNLEVFFIIASELFETLGVHGGGPSFSSPRCQWIPIIFDHDNKGAMDRRLSAWVLQLLLRLQHHSPLASLHPWVYLGMPLLQPQHLDDFILRLWPVALVFIVVDDDTAAFVIRLQYWSVDYCGSVVVRVFVAIGAFSLSFLGLLDPRGELF